MWVKVIGWDCDPIWTLEATSYTVTSEGLLTVALVDGTAREFGEGEWIDIRPASDGMRWGPTGPTSQ